MCTRCDDDEVGDERLDRRLRAFNDALKAVFAADLDDPERQALFLDAVARARRRTVWWRCRR